jgi:hypothetical protein
MRIAVELGLAFTLVLSACGASEYEKEKLAFEKKKYEDEQAAKAEAARKEEQDKTEQQQHWVTCRGEAEEDYNHESEHWGTPVVGKPGVHEGPAKQLEDMKNRLQRAKEGCDRNYPKGRSW